MKRGSLVEQDKESLSRRDFLKLLGLFGGWLLAFGKLKFPAGGQMVSAPPKEGLHEALFYKQLPAANVQCRLCYLNCLIPPNRRGACHSRENQGGTLYALTYARPVAIHINPVERMPLFHFLPSTNTLSVGSATCNFACKFCINWAIARRKPEEVKSIPVTAEELVQMALRESIPTICFTYNEPTQQYEYVLDVFRLAKAKGLRTTLQTNGGINPEPLEFLRPYTDSVAIDLKGFTDSFYKDIVRGELAPVLRTIELLKERGLWFEIVNLVIPTLNDRSDEISDMCQWIVQHLGPDVPVHFLRFFPAYRLTHLPPTPLRTLERAHNISKEAGINYAYIGNVPGHNYAHTYCPNCEQLLIRRQMFFVSEVGFTDGHCKYCGQMVPGMWE